MDIQQKDDGKQGTFELHDGEKLAGEMIYTRANDKQFIIDHINVADDYRGQGIGRQLMDAVVDFSRKNQITLIPLCPYAKSVFDKTPSMHDVLGNA